jgi:hypothetical protein
MCTSFHPFILPKPVGLGDLGGWGGDSGLDKVHPCRGLTDAASEARIEMAGHGDHQGIL